MADFYKLQGEEVHEVAVGPVHAGVIEPGHFRFQCHGERVFHLEISLGYQHRGIEEALVDGPHKITFHQMETAAGDTTIGHALAHCQVLEALANGKVPARAQALRGVALELERLANHIGDLGALPQDVGYLPAAAFCGRIRGDFLNLTALLCGSRLGRGFIRPGGTGFDLDERRTGDLIERLEKLRDDLNAAVELLWREPSVISRFENTGILSKPDAEELGLVGPPARASGIGRDVRRDFAFGIYRFFQLPVVTASTGDVFARAFIRWREIQQSLDFVLKQLGNLPSATSSPSPGFRPERLTPRKLAVSLVEGWRGEICHVAITDAEGKFARYKIIDPSFHNWFGLALAMRGAQISDFPLCNKSFNLSYCGHDL
jgi:Ni,Fe-hydrogenase III large subunit